MSSDLHMHTTVSDGRLSPLELVAAAKRAGLRYMAITDHDSVDGLLALREAGAYPDGEIEILPGVEFSADAPQGEVHILGYGIDPLCPALRERLETVTAHRRRRFAAMLEKLQCLGYELSREEAAVFAGSSKSVGRAHIAQALVRKGYFSTLGGAFADVLRKNGPAYVPHYRLTQSEIVALIHAAGGLAVVAHPGQIGDDGVVEELIAAGLDGIEAFHPKHSAAQMRAYELLAQRRGLFVTGGSDYHAILTRYPAELGEFTIDDHYAAVLLERIQAAWQL